MEECQEKIFSVKIKNCNNIIESNILIQENYLNLKYAMNGTGKSTISKALKIYCEDKNFDDLKPFTQIGMPEVSVNKEIGKILTFDENFINNVVFKENEVIKDSFDIFIKTSDYDTRRATLNERLKFLKIDVGSDPNTINLLNNFGTITSKILLNKDNSVKQNPFIKSILKRENIHNIPPKLSRYQSFMQDDSSIEWIDWKSKGFAYDSKNICPFCTEKLHEKYNEEKEVFKSTYDKKSTKDLIDMLELFTNLKEYISDSKYNLLLNCIKKESDKELISLQLSKFTQEIMFIRDKVKNVIEFDSYTIKNEEISVLDKKVELLKIDTSALDIFTNDKTLYLLDVINQKIDKIISEVEELKKEVGALNGYIQAAVKQSKKDINDFLDSAGINYEVDIIVIDENNAKTILKYKCEENKTCEVNNIKKHLSWGEKNAFALVLFMHYSIQQNIDIIILDDPISSFDSNKKYAIINRLFKKMPKGNSLYNKTVLMLTHDFEPIIDFVINHKPTGGFVNACYLKNSNGFVSETNISDDSDIIPLNTMLYDNFNNMELSIVHRVIFLRKFIELTSMKDSQVAYDILSSLIHGKIIPDRKINEENYEALKPEEIDVGTKLIKKYITNFDYKFNLEKYYTADNLRNEYIKEQNNYLKLQIFREYLEIEEMRKKIKDDVVLKFVDNIYHIENDFTYCLNIFKFDIVPEYIINRINEFMKKECNK